MQAFISPAALADRLVAGHAITLLDVRDEQEGTISAPGARTIHMPAGDILDHAAEIAVGLSGPVAVLCNRGVTARSVAPRLRELDVDAVVLEGGMRAWIAMLVAHVVALEIDGLAVHQVQRPGRGCLSYLLAAGGRALVVDPAPDAAFYVTLADRLGARIADVVDTHLHADHLSGARALADVTGARSAFPPGRSSAGSPTPTASSRCTTATSSSSATSRCACSRCPVTRPT